MYDCCLRRLLTTPDVRQRKDALALWAFAKERLANV